MGGGGGGFQHNTLLLNTSLLLLLPLDTPRGSLGTLPSRHSVETIDLQTLAPQHDLFTLENIFKKKRKH